MFVLFFFIPYFHPLFSCFSSGLWLIVPIFVIVFYHNILLDLKIIPILACEYELYVNIDITGFQFSSINL
ncbi:hypothetical protein IYZ83_005890 [Wolbachia pipientis]|uniref:hypothetical protein n=1 Tax=Wolbachia pipientis TaxID=955 RepID=UPI001F3BFE8E|nr:hypothetical protein [Wolbachia pipientis]UIP91644.1 hypothetical protein IYZ83_005890 [Wolbachia pipientis]